MSPVTREAILKEARSWIGVPFLANGIDRTGIDCAHFVLRVIEAVGIISRGEIEIPPWAGAPDEGVFRPLLEKCAIETRREAVKPGDCIVVNEIQSGARRRAGIAPRARHLYLIGDSKLGLTIIGVGEVETKARVYEERIDTTLLERVHSAWRFKAVAA